MPRPFGLFFCERKSGCGQEVLAHRKTNCAFVYRRRSAHWIHHAYLILVMTIQEFRVWPVIAPMLAYSNLMFIEWYRIRWPRHSNACMAGTFIFDSIFYAPIANAISLNSVMSAPAGNTQIPVTVLWLQAET
jgi:hypothetical protein